MPIALASLCILCLLAPLAAEDGSTVWVSVDYTDPSSGETHYYLARVARSALQSLSSAQGPSLLRLEAVCFFDTDDAGGIRGVIDFADEQDSGILYLPVSRILQVSELRDDPRRLVPDREAGGAEAGGIP